MKFGYLRKSRRKIKNQKVKKIVVKKDKKRVDKEDRKETSDERSEEDRREFFPQASMETPMLKRGVMYAEVNTRKNGLTDAEVGLMYDEVDTKACVEGQQVWEYDSYGTTRTETSSVHGCLRSRKWVSKKDIDKAYVS